MYIKPPYGSGAFVASGSPEKRWAFLRKVYSILAIQMLLTVVVASTVVYVQPVNLFVSTPGGLVLYISSLILPIIVLCHLYFFYQSYPVNLFSLGAFIVTISFAVGMTCSFTKGKLFIILESVILTLFVFIILALYTFCAEKYARKIKWMDGREQFLMAAVIILVVFSLIQMYFPLGRHLLMICSGIASLIFCGYIIYDTDNLIWLYSKEEYVWAAVAPYVDIVNYFFSLLKLIRESLRGETN
ncbi:BI1-like protein [Carex littledalei]|uniref:BI1-like protein n=1 Tax=Carex littledalei TaxID=544730 RepID=A0A833RKT8_9POAL|nr:BI1-like protein [Carex littledalei]